MVGELVNRVYDKGGSLRREEPYLNGVLHGALRAYHSNRKLARYHVNARLISALRQQPVTSRLAGTLAHRAMRTE